MSTVPTSSSSTTATAANLLQQLNTLSNPNGTGLPVAQYVSDYQSVLTDQLTTSSNTQLNTLSAEQTALSGLQTAIQSFQQATQALASSQSWNTVSGTSSDTSAFTVTSAPGAQPANYSLQVMSLATNQTDIQNISGQYQTSSSGTSNLNSGTLVITPNTANNGQALTINVSTGESLNSIASAINQQTSTTGVQASIINSGQGTYFLSLSSTNTGTANGFQVGGTIVGGAVGQLQFSQSSASDATIQLDGQTLTSSTNTFTNNIPNVTIQVLQTMSSPGALSLTSDSNSSVKAVQTWMAAYNTLIDTVKTDTAYTPPAAGSTSTTGTAGPLFGNPMASNLLSQLPADIGGTVTTSDAAINSLSSLGIVVDPSTGHIEFQSSSGFGSAPGTLQDGQTMFENALNSNSVAVQQAFGVIATSSSSAVPQSGVLGQLNGTLSDLLTGGMSGNSPIQSELNSISAQQQNIQNYLKSVRQQISTQVTNYQNQLNLLNSVMQSSQNQMKEISAMFGGAATASSSSTSVLG